MYLEFEEGRRRGEDCSGFPPKKLSGYSLEVGAIFLELSDGIPLLGKETALS
jgi:hypothetical protein